MLFSSLTFLYVFLPLMLAAYFLAPKRAKNVVLLLGSLLFYFYGEPKYTLLLFFSSLSDWLHALYIEAHRGEASAKRALVSSIAINLMLLGVFKYADFIIGSVNALFGWSIPKTNLPLPIGISFFTFQTMSYTIDVYRGRAHAQRNIATFATYVCLFPQLVAGPIVRYTDVEVRLQAPGSTVDSVAYGVRRFCIGLGKKVLLANSLGELNGFLAGGTESMLGAFGAAVAYMLQIYFDFSGYSDMAIGLGALFGFHFPENFNYPYISRSVTEFWRRWHMTLSGWFRDYVYIPLGGNRVSKPRWALNLMLVWAATGLWHGAKWNFVLWGAYFGVLLILEKLLFGKALEKLPRWIGRAYTLLAVLLGFVLFAGDSVSAAWRQIAAMFGGAPLYAAEAVYYLKSYLVVLLISAIGATPLPTRFAAWLTRGRERLSTALETAWCALLLLLSTAMLVDASFNPFLYFRF